MTPAGGRERRRVPAEEQAELKQIAAWMDECNLHTLINLTGGNSETIPAIRKAIAPFGARYVTAAEPVWSRANESGFAQWQADELSKCKQAGAVGLKVLKVLGLSLRQDGKLVKLDDARFDPMWEAAGAHDLPVLIHTGDPGAFFTPIDRHNERYEELNAHPDWSFHGKDFPSNQELQDARQRLIQRHPKTQFVCLHVADSENLTMVSEWMDRRPNMHRPKSRRRG